MKYRFDNVGVAEVQGLVMALPDAARSEETQQIRTDLISWMMEKFNLTASQQQQLMQMPDDLRDSIASDLAGSWEDGVPITFFKEEKDEDGGIKDIIYGQRVTQSYTVNTQSRSTVAQMSIWIRYR